jgi:hypothetical protein
MFKSLKNYIFPILVAVSALALAGAAAFFSVTGLSKLFGGAQGAVIIMASSLEFAKIITASFLHRYWKTLDWKLKTYLTIGTITIMVITSAGIYGFLSSAYSETSNKLQNIDGQISIVEQKKQVITEDIKRLESSQKLKQDRVQSLISLRSQQEARVDSLYNRKRTTVAKRVEDQIAQSNAEIENTTKEADELSKKIEAKSEEVGALGVEILNLKNNDVAAEVGPLKYIANLTGKSMDSVVNFFILLLIFVFDPMAVCLIIATNITLEKAGMKSLADVITLPKKKEEDVVEEIGVPVEEPKLVEPKQKIEYKSNENGEFVQQAPEETMNNEEKLQILEAIKSQGIEGNKLYLTFVEALYLNGALKVGDLLPPFIKFTEELNSRGVVYEEKEVMDFLTICNLLKVTDMSGPDRRVAKDYNVAKGIFNILSSK